MFTKWIVLILAMFTTCGAKIWQVAVEDLTAQGVPATEASILSDRLRSEMLATGAFRVLERSQMDKVLKEQAFEASGACESGQCAVQLGRLLSVDRLVVGSVGRIGSVYTLQVRLLDVETGEVLTTASEDRSGAIEGLLTKSIPAIAGRLAQVSEKGRQGSLVKPGSLTDLPGTSLATGSKSPPPGARRWIRWGAFASAIGVGVAGVVFHLDAQDRKKAADDAVAKYQVATSGFETLKTEHSQAVKDANSATSNAIACDVAAGVLLGGFALTYAF